MAKIGTLGTISDLTATTTATTVLNNNFATINTAFQNTYSLDGSMPDQLQATMDANSNRIVNLLSPISTTEPVTLSYLNQVLTTGTSLSGLTGVSISAAMQPVVQASTIASAQALFMGGIVTIGPSTDQMLINTSGITYPGVHTEFHWTPHDTGGVNSGNIISIPTIVSANLTNPDAYCQAFTAQIGQGSGTTGPIPAGCKGNFSGFECNITTNQLVSDSSGGAFTGHGFGSTIINNGGAQYDSADLTIIVNGAAIAANIDCSIVNNNAGSDCTNINVSSIGTHPCNFAFQCSGAYNAGLSLNGNLIMGCTEIAFSLSNNIPLYFINGSSVGLFTITGGGTAPGGGGVLNYTQQGSGNSGSFYVRNNAVDSIDQLRIDQSGNGFFLGSLSQAGGTVGMVYTTSLGSYNASQTATLTNGPTAGNPTKWYAINDNGTTRYCPAW